MTLFGWRKYYSTGILSFFLESESRKPKGTWFGTGIREFGLGIGIGIRNFKSGHILMARYWQVAIGIGTRIKVLGLESESEWNQWTSCRNQTFELSWNWNLNWNQDAPWIMRHWWKGINSIQVKFPLHQPEWFEKYSFLLQSNNVSFIKFDFLSE